jgi:uncharacterized protein YaaW (UPF0174 family)
MKKPLKTYFLHSQLLIELFDENLSTTLEQAKKELINNFADPTISIFEPLQVHNREIRIAFEAGY